MKDLAGIRNRMVKEDNDKIKLRVVQIVIKENL